MAATPLPTAGGSIDTLAFSPDSTMLHAGGGKHVPLQKHVMDPGRAASFLRPWRPASVRPQMFLKVRHRAEHVELRNPLLARTARVLRRTVGVKARVEMGSRINPYSDKIMLSSTLRSCMR